MEQAPSPEAVERALKLQKGTVLAAEVERLRAENAELRQAILVVQCDGVEHHELARLRAENAELRQATIVVQCDGVEHHELERLRVERDATLNMLEGYDPDLTRRLREQIAFERKRP